MLLIYLESTFHIFTLLLILIFGGVRDSWPEEYGAMNFTYPFIKIFCFFYKKKYRLILKLNEKIKWYLAQSICFSVTYHSLLLKGKTLLQRNAYFQLRWPTLTKSHKPMPNLLVWNMTVSIGFSQALITNIDGKILLCSIKAKCMLSKSLNLLPYSFLRI